MLDQKIDGRLKALTTTTADKFGDVFTKLGHETGARLQVSGSKHWRCSLCTHAASDPPLPPRPRPLPPAVLQAAKAFAEEVAAVAAAAATSQSVAAAEYGKATDRKIADSIEL